jgi:hypothetical protein
MWIDESAADELDAMAERFLNEAEAQLGRTAADMLLATLAKKVLGDAMIQSEEKPAPPRVEGGSHG